MKLHLEPVMAETECVLCGGTIFAVPVHYGCFNKTERQYRITCHSCGIDSHFKVYGKQDDFHKRGTLKVGFRQCVESLVKKNLERWVGEL